MVITHDARNQVRRAMRAKGLSQADLARLLDVSTPWFTRCFSGRLQTLRPDLRDKLERTLDIQFFRLVERSIPSWAAGLIDASAANPEIPRIAHELLSLLSATATDQRGFDQRRVAETPSPYHSDSDPSQ